MAKGKSTWKYNKLLTARRNYFALGDTIRRLPYTPPSSVPVPQLADVSTAKIEDVKLPQNNHNNKTGFDWNGTAGAAVGAAATAIGKIGGGLIGGDLSSGAGNTLSGLSSIASTIPGPWGTVASAGLGLVGGLANRMFGSKMNTENIAKVESNINSLNNFQSNASDFDTLSQNWANADVGMTFSDRFIGKDGWFSNKAKNKAADLRRQIETGNAWVQNTLTNNAENIDTTQMQNLLGNYAAFGGPLLYSKGGSIHIKPENRGKFTETKRRTGKTTEELTHSSNPLTRKRAIFAQNAKKWHHAFGGNLFDEGGLKNYDSTLPGRLTNYAENPDSVGYNHLTHRWYAPNKPGYDKNNRGMGVDINRNPRISGKLRYDKNNKRSYLTEEDERLLRHASMDDAEKSYKQRLKYANDVILGKNRDRTIIPSELKESLIRDLIYYRGPGYVANNPFEDQFFMRTLLNGSDQELYNEVKKHYADPSREARITEFLNKNGYPDIKAFGGELNTQGGDFTNGLLYIDNGGSHETNPYEGVQLGVDPEGTPNLVEEGETVFNDYVFSKRMKVPKEVRNKYKMGGTKNITFAEMSKRLAKESEERPNDPISMRGLEAIMYDLANAQEALKAENNNAITEGNKFATGGYAYENRKNDASVTNSSVFAPYFSNGTFDFGAMYADNSDYRKRLDPIASALYKKKSNPNYQYSNDEASALIAYIDSVNRWNPNRKYNNINELTYDRIIGDALTTTDGSVFTYNPNARNRGYALDMKRGGHHWGVATVAAPATQEPRTAQDKRYFEYGTGTPITDYFDIPDSTGKTWLDYHPEYSFVDRNGVVRDPVDINGVSTTYTDYFLKKKEEEPEKTPDEWKMGKYADWLRYAPVIGYGAAAVTDALGITNKPDYSNADAVFEATKRAGAYQPVRFRPIGNYLTYRPFDRDYYINKLNAGASASRRALMNTSGGNRATAMAGILAADNNYLNQIGSLARQAEEYNLEQRQRVEDFNSKTNLANSQGFLEADMANQRALASAAELTAKGNIAAAEMREKIRQTSDAARSANISGLFETLGNIGFEEKNARMRDWAIKHGVFGPGTEDYGRVRKKAKGGKIKKKKGLTV